MQTKGVFEMKQFNNRLELRNIQTRLRKAIQESHFKQKEIAFAVGVSEKTISAYMNKDVFPALDTLAKLCIFLDVSPDVILGITKNR